MSLRARLTLALTAFFVVPLTVLMGVGYYQSRSSLFASERKRLETLATLKGAQLRGRVEAHRRIAQRLRGDFAEQRVGQHAEAPQDRAWSEWVRAAAAGVDPNTELAVLDLQGTVRAASRPGLVGQNWSGAPGIAAGRMRTSSVGPHRRPDTAIALQDAVYVPLRLSGLTVAQLAVLGNTVAFREWLGSDLPAGARTIVVGLDGRKLLEWPAAADDVGDTTTARNVTARHELSPGGAELVLSLPDARVMRPFVILRWIGVGALLALTAAAVGVAMKLAQRIVTRERTLQIRLVHQEKMAAVGSLAAGVAHEIGNPLASLSSLVQVRLRRTEDSSERADLGLLLDHVDRINRTVKSLTRAARESAGGKRPTLLQDVAARAVELVRHDPRARGVRVTASGDPSAPALLLDEDSWLQVVMNLLLNALDAVADTDRPGSSSVSVHVGLEDRSVVLKVSDTGCGMSPEVRARATDPLFTTKAPGRGTGMGLHFVAEVVKTCGGTLDVASTPGRGTTIRIALPRPRA